MNEFRLQKNNHCVLISFSRRFLKQVSHNELYYKSNIMYSNILMSKHLVMYHTTQRSLFALALFNWRNLEKSCHLDIRCMYHICASIILLHWNCLLWILIFLLWLNDIEFLFRKFNDFLCNLSAEKNKFTSYIQLVLKICIFNIIMSHNNR